MKQETMIAIKKLAERAPSQLNPIEKKLVAAYLKAIKVPSPVQNISANAKPRVAYKYEVTEEKIDKYGRDRALPLGNHNQPVVQ
jgi:hypothetical protein